MRENHYHTRNYYLKNSINNITKIISTFKHFVEKFIQCPCPRNLVEEGKFNIEFDIVRVLAANRYLLVYLAVVSGKSVTLTLDSMTNKLISTNALVININPMLEYKFIDLVST